ncbi:unnamed protein product [Effrenium voratum]|nr:unnamed protein product [Effrenium voratum]
MRHVCTRVQSLKVSLRAPAKAWRSCHALSGGQVKCWGANTGGKLGTGNTASYGDSAGEMGANLPAVDLGTGRTAVAISLGQDHTCALLDNGSMKCWGDNSQGQLGYGDTTSRGSNSAHMGDNLAAIDLGDGRTATAIATGQYHTCAILDDWSTKCWGYNDNGQLGLGHTNNIGDGAAEMGNSLAAVNLGTGRFAKKISAGAGITCVVLLDDTALCWGKNNGGQLGQDSTTNMGSTSGNSVDSMSTINLGSGRTAKIVAPGEFHVCALLDDDTVKCWGSSSYGQLGQGDTSSWGTTVELGQSASALATSTHHNCVRLADDSLRCWGYNGSGELGLGDTANRGDGSGEMGTSLPAVSLGTGRTVTTAAEMGDNLAVVELFPTTTTSTFSTSTTTTRSASTTSTTSTGTSSTATTITTSTSASTSATSTASTSTSTTSTTGTRTSVTGTSTSTSATGTTSTSASTSTSSSSTSSSTSTTTTTSGTSSATVTSSRTSATHTRSTTTSTSSTGSTSSITTTISSTRSTTASSSSTSSSSSSSFSSSSTSASTSWTSSSSRTSSTSTTASSTSTTTNTRTSATGSTSTTSSTSSTSSSSATFTSTTTISSTVTRSSTTRTFQGAAEVAAYMEQQRVEAVNSAVSSAEAAAQAVPCQCRLMARVDVWPKNHHLPSRGSGCLGKAAPAAAGCGGAHDAVGAADA